MRESVTLNDYDQHRTYHVDVDFEWTDGLPANRIDPGEAAGVLEIESVRCTKYVAWCGKEGDDVFPDDERMRGAWCLEKYEPEIRAELAKLVPQPV